MAKIYAVKKGRKTGIFTSWDSCREQIDKFPNAEYKSFKNITDAEEYLGQADTGEEETPMVKSGKEKQTIYAVKCGRTCGIYGSWEDCKEQVDHYPGAEYKSFTDGILALQYMGWTTGM